MNRTAAITLVTLLFTFAANASDLNSRRDAALALIPFHWQKLNFDIVFLAPRPGLRAMTFTAAHRIEVYDRPRDTSRMQAYDIAHELGHVIDVTYNTKETREKYMRLRGIDPATPWFGCNRCSDFSTPAGDFAETFALIQFGPQDFRGKIAPPPTAKQIPALTSFFDSILS
jgi:hypothetical protein